MKLGLSKTKELFVFYSFTSVSCTQCTAAKQMLLFLQGEKGKMFLKTEQVSLRATIKSFKFDTFGLKKRTEQDLRPET